MTLIGAAEQCGEKRIEYENEAICIVYAAAAQGATLGSCGLSAFQFQCPAHAHLQKDLCRSCPDFECAGY